MAVVAVAVAVGLAWSMMREPREGEITRSTPAVGFFLLPAVALLVAVGMIRQACEIRLDARQVQVRRAWRTRSMPLLDVRRAWVDDSHMAKPTLGLPFLAWRLGGGEHDYFPAVDVKLEDSRGRKLKFRSIEPAPLLRVLDRALPAQAKREGRAWALVGVETRESRKAAKGIETWVE